MHCTLCYKMSDTKFIALMEKAEAITALNGPLLFEGSNDDPLIDHHPPRPLLHLHFLHPYPSSLTTRSSH